MSELKRCPECGANTCLVEFPSALAYPDVEWSVRCTVCDGLDSRFGWFSTKEDAIKAWNTRAKEEAKNE
jgi:hypothetical protein